MCVCVSTGSIDFERKSVIKLTRVYRGVSLSLLVNIFCNEAIICIHNYTHTHTHTHTMLSY